jgi:hypothetical protein
MQSSNHIETKDTAGFSFQVDMLHLNLHLAESEKSTEPQTRAHEAALAQLITLTARA